jgi:hypothetical protein
VLQRTPGTLRVSSKLRGPAPLNTTLGVMNVGAVLAGVLVVTGCASSGHLVRTKSAAVDWVKRTYPAYCKDDLCVFEPSLFEGRWYVFVEKRSRLPGEALSQPSWLIFCVTSSGSECEEPNYAPMD